MNDIIGKRRFGMCIVLYGCAAIGLGVRLAFLHLGPHTQQRADIRKYRQIARDIRVERGNIYDRNGAQNILAMDLALKDVCADPKTIVEAGQVLDVSATLGSLLSLPVDEVAVRLNRPNRRYARLKRHAHDELVKQIAERELPGIFFRDAYTRYYPQRTFLCHVLGFVNHEGVGSAGIELKLNSYLKGSPGRMESMADARRHELYWRRGQVVPAMAGNDVELTIDQNVQYIVEKVIDGVVDEYNAKGAWIIVERVKTGEILAMASRPAYDLNSFATASADERLNRAIGYVYEPGSTFKAAVISAALNENLVTPDTIFDCENGSWFYGGRPLRDYHAYGKLSLADGLKKSSNIMTAKVALMLGDDRLESYLRAFGVGSALGLDLPGEEAGILRPASKWSAIAPTRIAIGQGVAVTGLQMLNMYCAIANDGYLMRPYVIASIQSRDGTTLMRRRPHVIRSVIHPRTAATMKHLLARVTDDGGTGRRARVEGFRVAGKTGTAQKPVAGGYSSEAHIASFVGFLPAEDPELGIIVVVDEPQPIRTGGRVAAPAFAAIADEAVRCLGIRSSTYQLVSGSPHRRGGGEW